MSKYYYIDANGAQHGPLDLEILINSGITSDTMVRAYGDTVWKRAVEVSEIAEMFWKSRVRPNEKTSIPNRPKVDVGNNQIGQSSRFTDYSAKPNTYLWLGICSAILCCLPFGIVSIVYGAKVDTLWFAGHHDEAMNYSNKAKNWGIAAAVTSLLLWLIYFIVVASSAHRYRF